jgi:hypothetical protein
MVPEDWRLAVIGLVRTKRVSSHGLGRRRGLRPRPGSLPSPSLIALVGLILRRRQVEQLTRSRDVLDAPAVGERTVVADAVETLRQDVGKKAAHWQLCHGNGRTSGAV